MEGKVMLMVEKRDKEVAAMDREVSIDGKAMW